MNFICFFYINNPQCKSDPQKEEKNESFPKKGLPVAVGTLNFFSLSATNKKNFESAKNKPYIPACRRLHLQRCLLVLRIAQRNCFEYPVPVFRNLRQLGHDKRHKRTRQKDKETKAAWEKRFQYPPALIFPSKTPQHPSRKRPKFRLSTHQYTTMSWSSILTRNLRKRFK